MLLWFSFYDCLIYNRKLRVDKKKCHKNKLKQILVVEFKNIHHGDCQNFSILNSAEMRKDTLFLLNMFMMMMLMRQKQKLCGCQRREALTAKQKVYAQFIANMLNLIYFQLNKDEAKRGVKC